MYRFIQTSLQVVSSYFYSDELMPIDGEDFSHEDEQQKELLAMANLRKEARGREQRQYVLWRMVGNPETTVLAILPMAEFAERDEAFRRPDRCMLGL